MRKGTLTQPERHVADTLEALGDQVKPRLRGVLHQGAFMASLVTGTVLITLAGGTMPHVAAILYAASVVLLFGTSATYHRVRWSPRARDHMERLDHSMIFILIAGTNTPFTLLLLDGAWRWTLFVLIWAGAVGGIISKQASWNGPRWFSVSLYLAMGWSGLAILPEALHRGGVAVLVLLAVGGVFYSIGAVVYARRKPDPWPAWFGFHEIFHALTLAAFVVHYVAVSLVVYDAS